MERYRYPRAPFGPVNDRDGIRSGTKIGSRFVGLGLGLGTISAEKGVGGGITMLFGKIINQLDRRMKPMMENFLG